MRALHNNLYMMYSFVIQNFRVIIWVFSAIKVVIKAACLATSLKSLIITSQIMCYAK